jgi:hypothetical protein
MDEKDRIIAAENCNTSVSNVMAALIRAGAFSYEDVRAHWADFHSIIYSNTFDAAAAQAVVQAMPGTQVAHTAPPPPAAPQGAPTGLSAPPTAAPPAAPPRRNKLPWVREAEFPHIMGAIEYERGNGITFGSTQSNFYCNRSAKEAGHLPDGRPINVETYADAKVKPERLLDGEWGSALTPYADFAIDFSNLPSSFTRPPVYVRS